MKTIKEIYEEYKIIPGLQQHQLRVAAAAKQICESMKMPVDTDNVVKTCLIHDMGNIIKSIFSKFPEFVQDKGLDYWQNVKNDYIKKYGPDEHVATLKIAKEIGANRKIIQNLNCMGFSKAILNANEGTMEAKIGCYADMRVGPYGVLSLKARLEEGAKRYRGTKKWIIDEEVYKEIVKSIYQIEKQIFAESKITPKEITDQSIAKDITNLSNITF